MDTELWIPASLVVPELPNSCKLLKTHGGGLSQASRRTSSHLAGWLSILVPGLI